MRGSALASCRAEPVIDDVDADTKRVSGCGTTAMDVEMCLEGMGCSWEPKPDPEQPSPPTGTSGARQR